MANQPPQNAVETWVQSPVAALLKKHRDVIETVAKGVLDEARVMRLIRAAILRDQNIINCTPISVLNAVLYITYLGLEIAPDSAYILAFRNRKDGGKMVATAVIDYRGKVRVAANSGIVFDDPQIIYSAEPFKFWTDENGTHFRHEPMITATAEQRGTPVAAYVVTRFAGVAKVTLMRADEILAIKAASLARTGNTGPWVDHEIRMWAKSVIHRAFKTVPRPTDQDAAERMRRTQELDDANDMAELPEPFIDDPEAELAGPMIPAGSQDLQDATAAKKIEDLKSSAETARRKEGKADKSGGEKQPDGPNPDSGAPAGPGVAAAPVDRALTPAENRQIDAEILKQDEKRAAVPKFGEKPPERPRFGRR